jgi:hypothetical protein
MPKEILRNNTGNPQRVYDSKGRAYFLKPGEEKEVSIDTKKKKPKEDKE